MKTCNKDYINIKIKQTGHTYRLGRPVYTIINDLVEKGQRI